VLSAYFTRLGHFLMRGVDVLMAFRALLLAMVLMTLLERSVTCTIVVTGIVYVTTTARILFGMTLKLKGEVFVDATICSGAGHGSILFRAYPAKPDFTPAGAGQLHLCVRPIAGRRA